jgi:hypothetical protein
LDNGEKKRVEGDMEGREGVGRERVVQATNSRPPWVMLCKILRAHRDDVDRDGAHAGIVVGWLHP